MGARLGGTGASPRVMRAGSATVALIVAGAATVLLLGDAWLRAGIVEMLRLAPWVLLAVWVVYVAMFASHIAYDDDGVMVQNYLRRTRIPWRHMRDISLRWQIVFAFDGGAVSAFGGPVVRRGDRVRRPTGAAAPGRSTGVPTSLREFGELHDAWQHASGATAAMDAGVVRSWDVPALSGLLIIVLGVVASVLATSV